MFNSGCKYNNILKKSRGVNTFWRHCISHTSGVSTHLSSKIVCCLWSDSVPNMTRLLPLSVGSPWAFVVSACASERRAGDVRGLNTMGQKLIPHQTPNTPLLVWIWAVCGGPGALINRHCSQLAAHTERMRWPLATRGQRARCGKDWDPGGRERG